MKDPTRHAREMMLDSLRNIQNAMKKVAATLKAEPFDRSAFEASVLDYDKVVNTTAKTLLPPKTKTKSAKPQAEETDE